MAATGQRAAAVARSLPTRRITVPAEALCRGDGAATMHTAHWSGAVDDDSVIVLVHGLGGSHLNWSLLGPRLADAGWTVWGPDLAGFGLTELDGRSASMDDQLDLLAGFVSTVSDRPVRLVGNSMGGLLSLLLAAARPELVSSLVLTAPALPPVGRVDRDVVARFALSAAPGVAPWWFRHLARSQSAAVQTAELMHLCAADPSSLDRDVLRAHTALVAHRRLQGRVEKVMPAATRSLLRRLGPERATVWAAVDAVTVPTLLVGGDADRLISTATLDRLAARRSDWARVWLRGVGHVPMLEVPDRLAALAAARPVHRPRWPLEEG